MVAKDSRICSLEEQLLVARAELEMVRAERAQLLLERDALAKRLAVAELKVVELTAER